MPSAEEAAEHLTVRPRPFPGTGKTADRPTENATTAVRNQAMGHSRADIYEKYYTPQVVGADTQAAYLGSPSQSALIALAGRMSLTQDPRAHPCITAQVKAVMDTYVDSDSCCESRIASMRAEIKKRHGLLQAGSSTPLHTAYKSELRKRWQRRQAYRRAVEIEAREDYFRAVGDREIERQMLGRQEEDPQPSPSFCFGERRTLATLMCRMVDVDRLSHEERVKRRLEAFHNMKALCAMAEPKPHISRSPKRGASPAGPDDDGDDAAFDLVFTSLHCPWCFYNERASRAARATTFSKESNLLRHIDQHHLSRKTYGSDALCPYADCSFAPSSEEVLKNHLAREHGRRLRKKRLCNTPRPSGGAHITCLPIHTFEKKYLTTRPSTY